VWNGSLAKIQKKIRNTQPQIRLGKIQGFFRDFKEIQGHVVDFLGNSRTFT